MNKKHTVVELHPPRIEGNRVFLSWDDTPLFEESGYWIEYAGFEKLHCSADALLEAYLPICIALSFLGRVTIKLPVYIDPGVLESWRKICIETTRTLAKRTARLDFVVPDSVSEVSSTDKEFKKTALLFGGGTESSLTLAHLLDKGIAPYLVSLWLEGWMESNSYLQCDRFDLEQELCREFGLKIIRIHSNVITIFKKKNFKPYQRKKLYIVNAAFSLPIMVSTLLPLAETFSIGQIISGNEEENSYSRHFYSFSKEMTKNLYLLGKHTKYQSHLEDLNKIPIVEELHRKYPKIAKYQYSCFKNGKKRWCLSCAKCFKNYLIYKIIDVNPATVGMEEAQIRRNLPEIIFKLKRRKNKEKYFLMGWELIKKEAAARNKKDIVKIIASFLPSPLRRIWINKSECIL